MTTARLLDFLGQGEAASRPDAATLAAELPTGSAAIYFAYDTGIFSFLDANSPAWVEMDLAALAAMGFQDLADVDWTTPPTDGQIMVWDSGTSKFVPASLDYYTDTDADARVAAGIATHEADAAAHPDATTSTAGFMAAADKTKLDGIETAATANSSDATLLDRANHTGTQTVSTISDFETESLDLILTEIVTETGTTANLSADNVNKYQRWTATSAKTLTVQAEATAAMPNKGEWHIRNVGETDLTLVADTGVTIHAPYGGTLVVPTGGTVSLKRVVADEFDLIGQTVAA